MGTGRSGIPKGIRHTNKNLTEFRLTAKNLRDYNISMESRLRKNVEEEQLNRALQTVNEMASILGIDPNDLPKISLGFTKRKGVYGDCGMIYAWDKMQCDARIRLHPDMFADKNYDTMAHEYVHALEAWMIKQNFSRDWDQVNAWIDHTYSEAICVSALKKLGKQSTDTFDKAIWKANADTIKLGKWDDYASSKPSETITRAMQSVLRFGNKAPEYAKALVKELGNEVRNTQKRRKKK